MRIIRVKDYHDMSRKAADFLRAQITLFPKSVLGLATGGTPVGAYRQLVEWCKAGELSFAEISCVNLDEYAGLAPDDPQSYRFFMDTNLFDHIDIDKRRTFVPNGLAPDAAQECTRYEAIIESLGGIDLQLLGLGVNGHIGFNEPSACFAPRTHEVALTKETIHANERFFESASLVPRHAYTMGIGSILRAKSILLLVSGLSKAQALREAFFGPVAPQLPASILQLHPGVTLIGDEEALSLFH